MCSFFYKKGGKSPTAELASMFDKNNRNQFDTPRDGPLLLHTHTHTGTNKKKHRTGRRRRRRRKKTQTLLMMTTTTTTKKDGSLTPRHSSAFPNSKATTMDGIPWRADKQGWCSEFFFFSFSVFSLLSFFSPPGSPLRIAGGFIFPRDLTHTTFLLPPDGGWNEREPQSTHATNHNEFPTRNEEEGGKEGQGKTGGTHAHVQKDPQVPVCSLSPTLPPPSYHLHFASP